MGLQEAGLCGLDGRLRLMLQECIFGFRGGTKGRIIGGQILWAEVPGSKSGPVIGLHVFWQLVLSGHWH